ncbi:Receptor-interacting serine/threonine-protein kinase 1 [Leucoagaricus sp. SymC.cos]|nr:Receptor-interacting serine/threonine-protein kinase 1 [Leucoagaricus sp. SymC.cos]
MTQLVDHPSLQPSSKSCMIKTVMRLSQRSFLYPQSLLAEGIKRDDAFSREAMLWAHLSHPNILPFYRIFRLGDLHGRLALAPPWMAKGNLRNYLKDEPDADRILLLEDIVNGLQYLHDNQVVHGDLSGDNILITPSGRACLADFGLSNVVLTRLGNWYLKSTFLHVGGAVGWMAPELLLQDNAKPTIQGDIYALAMVFHEAFGGKMPFYEAATPAAIILRAIAGRRPTPPVNDSIAYTLLGLSQEIWDVMDKGWSSDPGARPPLQEFLRVLSGSERVDRRPKDTFGEALPPSKFRDAMNGVYRRMTIGEIEQIVSWFA